MLRIVFLLVFLVTIHALSSQTYLRIDKVRFGKVKTFDIYVNDFLDFKIRGEHHFQKARVRAFSDSTIVFSNDKEFKLDQIKCIRVDLQHRIIKPFTFLFIAGGIAFLPLNSFNNMLVGTEPVFSEKAAYISAGLIATGLIIRQMGIRRIRINKNTDLKVLTLDYRNLNSN